MFEVKVVNLEAELIRQCCKGDRKAQFMVYEKYSKAMYNVAIRMTGNTQEAEDILQDAFLTAFMKIKQFRQETGLAIWIRRIVINRCIDLIRKRKVEFSEIDNIPDIPEEEEPKVVDPEVIHKAIKQLPSGARTIITLHLLEGYTHKEIAEMIGVNESTSKTQFHRAKQLLIKKIKVHEHEIRE
ncbi:ECF RNA polymerase sigma factor SigW [subsurface metagenome]